ncbi:hypothetical protein SBOR_2691 [Sclerotinia borealis F-4128]|uniref:SMP-30/Gluconolactonase/LRE-like region domain-containing protein n=1 Tax=Sclerotinia borealis (strain F-4128) TaxID=1432307 RepID=W9CJG1_SCLBF|nr:hypothetical protein SBOR_2691 [Sclerotinia borealis F-4128]
MKLFTFLFQVPLLLGDSQGANNSIKTIYQFPQPVFIENIHTRDNGHLLLSTLANGTLVTIDPVAATPSPVPVVTISDSPSYALTGIATIDRNLYAVSGGIHLPYAFVNDSMSIYAVSIPENPHDGSAGVIDTIPITNPNRQLLNGMAALPATPWVVLSAESLCGCIYRTNTRTRAFDIAFSDPAFASTNSELPVGINGIQIRHNYVYFTNSDQGTFGRVKINRDGSKAGKVEVIAKYQGTLSLTAAYDDFTFDDEGNAYVASHPNSVVKITPHGVQTTIAGGGNSTLLLGPTALTISRDGKFIYVVTGGTSTVPSGGQIVRISI